MARPLRIAMADGVYHVTSRGLERRQIVRDDRDRHRWLAQLDEVARRRRWRVLAWALMDNHFHLFVRTPKPDLSAGLHDVNSAYATCFNRRHGRHGPLFQGRFKAILVEREHHYWELSRYIHLNPVRAGLVDDPREYGWSSCRAYFGRGGVPEWLAWEEVLAEYGRTVRAARQAYGRFLLAGVASPPRSPLRDAMAGTVLGSPGFLARVTSWVQQRLPDPEVPATRAFAPEQSVDQIVHAVCSAYGVSPESMTDRGRHHNEPRSVAVYLCRRLTRAPIALLGARFGGAHVSTVSHIVGRVRERRSRDKRFDAKLSHMEQGLAENANFKT